ncbi:hypothetical protein AV274_3323 [Blastocystis sp. ATCC 50177/Nand II]|uniref:Uncharacterized protein n=1 Tax=Blastocystis sp. subtype 1 (strain ATCC 50177 / NandII) TaxID=478820 RepID=A0A196SF78_BLAHN|nr:hypothetical protein AV274_3323 [Blastocystis sp. ATCC 50177/Nand II]
MRLTKKQNRVDSKRSIQERIKMMKFMQKAATDATERMKVELKRRKESRKEFARSLKNDDWIDEEQANDVKRLFNKVAKKLQL